MALTQFRFPVNFLLNDIMKRLCLGRLIIDNHFLTIHSNEPTLVHRASPPRAELAHGAAAQPANSEVSIIHWCLTKILVLLFAQVFHTNIVWKIQLFLLVSWCPAKPYSIDWNTACWCFVRLKKGMATFHPFSEWYNWPATENWGILTHSPLGWAHQLFPSCYHSHRLSSLGSLSLSKLICHHNCWPSLLWQQHKDHPKWALALQGSKWLTRTHPALAAWLVMAFWSQKMWKQYPRSDTGLKTNVLIMLALQNTYK